MNSCSNNRSIVFWHDTRIVFLSNIVLICIEDNIHLDILGYRMTLLILNMQCDIFFADKPIQYA